MTKLNTTIHKESPEEAKALAEFFSEMARHNEAYTNAVLEVPAAISQLTRSERGQRAFQAFKQLIDGGGYGLDDANWAALATLCRAQGYLPPALRDDEPPI